MKFVSAASAALVLACACSSTPAPAPVAAAPVAAKPVAAAPAKPAATQAAAATPAKPLADGDKVVCKTDTPVGKHVPVETCHTKTEWAAIKERNAEGVRDTQRSIQNQAGQNGN